MRDPEFIVLRNRFLIGLLIVTIFAVPSILIIKNKILIDEPTIIKKVENKEDIYILVTSNDCDNCNEYKNVLKKLKIDYIELNKSKNNSYDKILNRLKIDSTEVIPPTFIYIKEGEFYASLVDIRESSDINLFLENHELIKE